ncbi:CU044_5270 family protein [Streptomyces phaeochromogenes]|uniref:CU044_5270 family protein n=1 Tax=Streptomyces phaeochromogenes TaxID=1923 RepID=UPI0022554FF4|nr:CU044_5270 family protein [Streptomyces phaeochromogenes]MCX5603275.1 CU044_5270 family protein [Streptomyces phaeochromogenes]
MADELELLRRANPVPSGDPRFGDGPLGHEAERHLSRLMGPPADERPRPGRFLPGRGSLGRLLRGPRPRRTRLVWALATTAAVAMTSLALLLAGPSTTPAVAAPRPLVVRADSTPVPLDQLAERAEGAAADGSSGLRKGTHVQSWSMGMSEDKPPITLPVERVVRWNSDDSHTELVVATDPRHPGRPVLSEGDGDSGLVDDGHVISEQTFPPSWSDAPPESPPPHDAKRLRAYLQDAQHTDTPLTTPELLDATRLLLDTWTLGTREDAALVRLLADAEGLRPVGQVTDRLGRRGQAYVYDATGARQMLIMDPVTGAVLGLESTATVADPEYGLKAGDVMDYIAWMR